MLGVIHNTGNPKHIPDIDPNRTTVTLIPSEVVDGGFKRPVEIDPDEFSLRIKNRASRVSAGCVCIIKNRDRHIANLFIAATAGR